MPYFYKWDFGDVTGAADSATFDVAAEVLRMKSLLDENQIYIVRYQMLPSEGAAKIAFQKLDFSFSISPAEAPFLIGVQTRVLKGEATLVVFAQGKRSIVNVSGSNEKKGSENVSLDTIKALVKVTMDALDQGIDPFKN